MKEETSLIDLSLAVFNGAKVEYPRTDPWENLVIAAAKPLTTILKSEEYLARRLFGLTPVRLISDEPLKMIWQSKGGNKVTLYLDLQRDKYTNIFHFVDIFPIDAVLTRWKKVLPVEDLKIVEPMGKTPLSELEKDHFNWVVCGKMSKRVIKQIMRKNPELKGPNLTVKQEGLNQKYIADWESRYSIALHEEVEQSRSMICFKVNGKTIRIGYLTSRVVDEEKCPEELNATKIREISVDRKGFESVSTEQLIVMLEIFPQNWDKLIEAHRKNKVDEYFISLSIDQQNYLNYFNQCLINLCLRR